MTSAAAPDSSERAFEAELVDELTASGWLGGESRSCDASLGLLPADVVGFIRDTQPRKWDKLVSLSGSDGKSQQSLLNRLADQLGKRGTVEVLRRGITEKGAALKLAFFEPEIKLDPAALDLYAKNRLRVVRQVRFDPNGGDSVDVVLFVNGIPTATAELKNRWTGQNVQHAIKQYETSRDPKHALFKHALVHFAVDAELAYMTTRLEKGKTRFLPFNQGSGGAGEPGGAGNPPAAGGGHPTSYLWRQVWQRDAWMELLERFVFVEEPEVDPKTGKPPKDARPTVIFPRYHQWDVVRRCVATARAEGPGRNYLIQHSAGSGKSKEIAWLAHDLSTVHAADHKPVFDKVIVITDRRVLDSQLRKQVLAFEQTAGTVAAIEHDSTELREALFKAGVRVIITTLQKFPFVLKQLAGEETELKDSRYAVIVDEAHSSQTGESAVDLKRTLGATTAEDLELDPDEMDVPPEMLAHLAARGWQPNLSFFAFTATPKAKTLELFGETLADGGNARAFHTYSMRQAIDEGFILDVLRNYTSYEQLYRLANKADQEIEVPKGKAQSKLRRFATFHPYAKDQKAAVIVEHFRDTVRPHLGGQGKAMVVTASREEAVRYKQAIDRYVSTESYDGVKSLVAFSGEVEITDPDAGDYGEEYREGQMNRASAGHPVSDIPGEFDKPKYGVLIVAEKFQTGFDQPKLVGMYVDKPLSGVNAVQTLSRLNRIHPGKTETYIVDFVNDPDDVLAAFAPYYERTEAIPTEPNVLFDAAQKVADAGVITDEDLERFDQVFYSPDVKHSDLSTLTQAALDRANALDDKLEEFKADIDRFVRFYGFLSQVLPYVPPPTERLYRFSHLLRDRFDSTPDGGAVNLAGQIDLTHFRLEQLGTENLSLEGDPDPLSAIRGDGTGSAIAPKDMPMGLLGELVELFNERFGADLTDADALRPLLHVGDVIAAENPHFRDQALSNDEDDFIAGKEDVVTDAMFKVQDVNDAVLKQSLNDDEVLTRISAFLMKALYQSYNADTAS